MAGRRCCKLTQNGPSAATGKLTMIYKGDQAHAGFDNVAFFTKDLITFVEDAGDGAATASGTRSTPGSSST